MHLGFACIFPINYYLAIQGYRAYQKNSDEINFTVVASLMSDAEPEALFSDQHAMAKRGAKIL